MDTNIKLIIEKTIHTTIRVWIYYKEGSKDSVLNSKEYQLFELLSLWGGADKIHKDCYSWELSLTLTEYLKEKFSSYSNCEINYL